MTVLATLLLGLASVGAIGFSPTVYASGDRIHFVCQAALLLVALRLVAALEHEFGPRTAKVSIAIVAVVAAYRVLDRKSVVWGKRVSVRVDLGGRGIIKKKKKNIK